MPLRDGLFHSTEATATITPLTVPTTVYDGGSDGRTRHSNCRRSLQEGLLALGGEGVVDRLRRMGEAQVEALDRREVPGDPDARLAEVDPRLLARRMVLGHGHEWRARLELALQRGDDGPDGRLGHDRALLVEEPRPDPPGGVALLVTSSSSLRCRRRPAERTDSIALAREAKRANSVLARMQGDYTADRGAGVAGPRSHPSMRRFASGLVRLVVFAYATIGR